jgi:hypothetical protein
MEHRDDATASVVHGLRHCADDWSGSSRSIWSKSLSALGALEEVERGRRDTVVLSDR